MNEATTTLTRAAWVKSCNADDRHCLAAAVRGHRARMQGRESVLAATSAVRGPLRCVEKERESMTVNLRVEHNWPLAGPNV